MASGACSALSCWAGANRSSGTNILAKSIAFGGQEGFDVTTVPDADYLLKVVVANHDHLEKFLFGKLMQAGGAQSAPMGILR